MDAVHQRSWTAGPAGQSMNQRLLHGVTVKPPIRVVQHTHSREVVCMNDRPGKRKGHHKHRHNQRHLDD